MLCGINKVQNKCKYFAAKLLWLLVMWKAILFMNIVLPKCA